MIKLVQTKNNLGNIFPIIICFPNIFKSLKNNNVDKIILSKTNTKSIGNNLSASLTQARLMNISFWLQKPKVDLLFSKAFAICICYCNGYDTTPGSHCC